MSDPLEDKVARLNWKLEEMEFECELTRYLRWLEHTCLPPEMRCKMTKLSDLIDAEVYRWAQ